MQVIVDLNLIVKAVEPRLARALDPAIPLSITLAPLPCLVKADPADIDRVLTFFAGNARSPATVPVPLAITTMDLSLDDEGVRDVDLPPGRYAGIRITGVRLDEDGHDPHSVDQLFASLPTEGENDFDLFAACMTVKRWSGAIKCDTMADSTVYTILMPFATQDGGTAAHSPEAPTDPHTPVSVLIVEDDAMNRTLLRQMLMHQGFIVFEAENGPDALSILARERTISLLLTDIVMPDMDGCELGALVARCRPGIHILYTSGYVDDFAWRTQFAIKTHFLQKPFTQTQLCAKIREVLAVKDR